MSPKKLEQRGIALTRLSIASRRTGLYGRLVSPACIVYVVSKDFINNSIHITLCTTTDPTTRSSHSSTRGSAHDTHCLPPRYPMGTLWALPWRDRDPLCLRQRELSPNLQVPIALNGHFNHHSSFQSIWCTFACFYNVCTPGMAVSVAFDTDAKEFDADDESFPDGQIVLIALANDVTYRRLVTFACIQQHHSF